jgi:hypothetical protein
MAPTSTGDPKDLIIGSVLQMIEAATLGMPFEVWKTQQISSLRRDKVESCTESFKALWTQGLAKFYKGTGAKMIESGAKGGVLVYSSQAVLDMMEKSGFERSGGTAGLVSGFCGGVSQTVVMSPLTYIITYKNNNPHAGSGFSILQQAGIKGMYGSAPAMAMRQGSNWALRASLAGGITKQYRSWKGDELNKPERIMCGLLGGVVACVNQPTEVLRVVVQARQASGEKGVTTRNSASLVYKKYGFVGFYTGIVPRMGLSAWQTLFMVTGAGLLREWLTAVTGTK